MNILVVGGGGREHALCWRFADEGHTVRCAPGNPGIAKVAACIPVQVHDFDGLAQAAHGCDLVVVGPEDPLIDGLADHLRALGFAVYGPGKEAAQLEGSKAFSKALMAEAGVPTARFASFTQADLAKEFAAELCKTGRGAVVKASGNALGKGVTVCETLDEAKEAIDLMLVERVFGEAGAEIVVEERLVGPEFSLLTICGDRNFVSLPIAQDHKRVFDGDQGPNTGGMGTFSPVPWVSNELVERAEREVVAPILTALRSRGLPYRGTLFSGLLVQDGVPYCLEYNVRFGDPESQSVMRRLGGGLAEALLQAAIGEPITPPEVLANAVVSVVLASGGYPGPIEKGKPIAIGTLPPNVEVFHAGTAPGLVTAGGRVLAVSAAAPTLAAARRDAYAAAEAVSFDGKHYRTDIGA